MSQVGVLALNQGENVSSAVIDSDGTFLYLAITGTNYLNQSEYPVTGSIVKIRLSDFTRVGTLTLNPDETDLAVSIIDSAGGFAYFGTATAPGKIVKVRLSDFTRVGGAYSPSRRELDNLSRD